jgi:sugar lactone lactonase YvrE
VESDDDDDDDGSVVDLEGASEEEEEEEEEEDPDDEDPDGGAVSPGDNLFVVMHWQENIHDVRARKGATPTNRHSPSKSVRASVVHPEGFSSPET